MVKTPERYPESCPCLQCHTARGLCGSTMVPCETELPSRTQSVCLSFRKSSETGQRTRVEKPNTRQFRNQSQRPMVQILLGATHCAKKVYDLEHLKLLNANYKVCQCTIFLVTATMVNTSHTKECLLNNSVRLAHFSSTGKALLIARTK